VDLATTFLPRFDAKRFQELEIRVIDFEFGVSGESGDEGSFVGRFFALLADTYVLRTRKYRSRLF